MLATIQATCAAVPTCPMIRTNTAWSWLTAFHLQVDPLPHAQTCLRRHVAHGSVGEGERPRVDHHPRADADEQTAHGSVSNCHEPAPLARLVDRARRPGRLYRHAHRRPWLVPCAGRDRCLVAAADGQAVGVQNTVSCALGHKYIVQKREETTMELQIIDTETNNSSVLTSEKKTELQLVYFDRNYPPVKLIEPTTLGYIHIAAEVQPRSLPFSLFMPQRREKSELLTELKALAHRLEQLDAVEKVTVFHAGVMLPIERLPYIKQRKDSIRIPRFDIVVLIETKSVLATREVQTTPAYRPLEGERSDYLAINHARWDVSLLRIVWRQFSRATFGIYVQENLEANRVGSLPVWYWLV